MAQAVHLIGIDVAEKGMRHLAVGLDPGADFIAQGLGFLRQGLVLQQPGQQRGRSQRPDGEQVGGHQVAVTAGVVAGAEAAPGHAGVAHRLAPALVVQGVTGRAVSAGEAIGAVFVALLGAQHAHDGLHRLVEPLREEGRAAGGQVILFGQPQGIAQRVDLVLALPHPVGGPGRVVVGLVGGGLPVEGVGVGIPQHALRLPGDDALQHGGHLRLFGEAHVVQHLGGGIPQPHGGDVAGDDEGVAGGLLDGGLDGVQEAALKQRPQFGQGGHFALERRDTRAKGVEAGHGGQSPFRDLLMRLYCKAAGRI